MDAKYKENKAYMKKFGMPKKEANRMGLYVYEDFK